MASITELQELARKLSLANIAGGVVNLQKESLSNLDYLKYILESELAEREKKCYRKAPQGKSPAEKGLFHRDPEQGHCVAHPAVREPSLDRKG